MGLYALDSIMHAGREYHRGDELPKDLDDATADRLKEKELASTTQPKVDAEDLERIADAEGDAPPPVPEPDPYEGLSKAQLRELADERGLDVPKSATVEDLRAALEANPAE